MLTKVEPELQPLTNETMHISLGTANTANGARGKCLIFLANHIHNYCMCIG